jgi:hypothetical protein
MFVDVEALKGRNTFSDIAPFQGLRFLFDPSPRPSAAFDLGYRISHFQSEGDGTQRHIMAVISGLHVMTLSAVRRFRLYGSRNACLLRKVAVPRPGGRW